MKLDVVAIGDVVADVIIAIPRLPVRPEEHQMVRHMFVEAGGMCNFLIAAARLGLRAGAVDFMGDDHYGCQVRDILVREGVDISGIHVVEGGRTTLALVLVDDAGQHVFLGVMGNEGPPVFQQRWREMIESAEAVFTSGYSLRQLPPELMLQALRIAEAGGKPLFFDPSPDIPFVASQLVAEVLGKTTVLLLTLDEAEQLVGTRLAEEAVRLLLNRGPRMVILKLGGEGCLVATAEEVWRFPGLPVPMRDTTGAGDAFDAACVYGYLKGFSPPQMGAFANAVGAAKVMKLGAGSNVPTKEEVLAVLREHEVDVPFEG